MTPTAGTFARRLRRGLDVLLPPVCVLCGSGVDAGAPPLCGLCRGRLPRLSPPWCERCGATALRFGAPRSPCPECRDWSPELRAAAPFRMTGSAARVVHELKYRGWRRLAVPMAAAMLPAARRLTRRPAPAPARRSSPTTPELVPVPLSRSRRRRRGFNQAELLAAELARLTGWRLRHALRRRETGTPQARLGRSARAENVRGAFCVVEPGTAPGELPGPSLLLVDDVVTTGATAEACRRVLTEAGLSFLGVVAFARRTEPVAGPFVDPDPG